MAAANGEVAVARYDGTINAVTKSIELIKGLEGLKPSDSILIKPNLVWSLGGSAPKFGVITTSRLIEDIVILLREKGCARIAIGEGSLVNDEMGANTSKGFAWSGLTKVSKKYDVKLTDLNESHIKMKLGSSKVHVARAALETDFLINVPVLKTHAMTKVSLGMKNLKGCLSMNSKKIFHMLDLNEMIALLNTLIKPKLTVIDGIYGLERGPLPSGRAHRLNLIVSGKDVFSCDVVGSSILGIDPATVSHLRKFSEINERPLGLESVQVVGDEIKNLTKPMDWKMDFETFFLRAGIEGVLVQWPGDRFCTNCVMCSGILFACFCKDNPGIKLDPVEICFGADVTAKKDSKKVILFGNCAIRANKENKNAIRVEGCPPKIVDSMKTMMNHTLEKGRARKLFAIRFIKGIFSKFGLYEEKFPREFAYNIPDFDPKHF